MRYLTDRKRAVGKGSAHSGTEHHWYMTVSAVGLAFMVPTFIYIFGRPWGRATLPCWPLSRAPFRPC